MPFVVSPVSRDLRGLAVKEYPRWPTKPLSVEHMKMHEENMKGFLDELAALTPAPKKKIAV